MVFWIYMKLAFVAFIASFIGVAVFGFFGMNHNGAQSHNMTAGNCIAATAQGVNCPQKSEPIDFATFHIDAFKGFSLATLNDDVMRALMLVAAALSLIGMALSRQSFFQTPRFSSYQRKFNGFSPSPQKRELVRWLTMHENSPACS